MLNDLFEDGGNKAAALENLLNYIQRYYAQCGVDYNAAVVSNDLPMIEQTLSLTYAQLRKLSGPSIFKKLGAFTQNFVFSSPISKELPDSSYLPEVTRRWYHNAVIAYAVSRRCMLNAVVECSESHKTLSNPIVISKHQHRDFMHALCRVDDIKGDLPARFISLIYETLAYEFNDGVRYGPGEELKKTS